MRLWSPLACAAAASLAACGQDALPFPRPGASARAWCTWTVANTLGDCIVLEASDPQSAAWFLADLRASPDPPAWNRGIPVEMSLFINFAVKEAPSAP
ncbi:MAG TPA: hypothetical protein VFF12_12705 [Myxococcaceae bacterium]|nr:hypothetical protein [Myxococcaceae bacterium]